MIDLGGDDGWLDVQVRPAAGDPVTVRCDTYREFHTLAKLAQGDAG